MLKKKLLLTDVTVNNCAWNYIISLNEKILYIGRKISVDDHLSREIRLQHGVPQGSVLAPPPFLCILCWPVGSFPKA